MIKQRTFLAGLVALVALLVVGAATLSSEGGGSGLEIDWWTIEGGGGVANGAGYTLHGSVGQPDAGLATSGAGHQLQGGFWALPGGTNTPTPTGTPPPTATSTNTPPATATATSTNMPPATITATPSPGPSPTATATPSPSPSPTATETATPGPSPTPTVTADYSAYIPMLIR